MKFASLPTLGIGTSLSLSAQPDPVALVTTAGGPQFVEYAGLVDVDEVLDEVSAIRATGASVLYHPSCINFCGTHANSQRWLQATAAHIGAVASPWFAQDCAYCFWQDDFSYSTSLGYFIPPIFNRASLNIAIERVREVQAVMPVPVAIEPPPMAFQIGTMTLCDFFGELAEATDCAILLDMGHLVSYEMASGRRIAQELDHLPRERVIEVHIAGGRLRKAADGPVYVDAHEAPILDETWQMLRQMLPVLSNVKAVCFECEGVAQPRVLDTLQRIRQEVRTLSASTALTGALTP